jgi:hypothetical protein
VLIACSSLFLTGLIADEKRKAVNKERAGREKEKAQRKAGSKESLKRMRLSRRMAKHYTPSAIHHF